MSINEKKNHTHDSMAYFGLSNRFKRVKEELLGLEKILSNETLRHDKRLMRLANNTKLLQLAFDYFVVY